MYLAFVYMISLNEKPVYIGSSTRYGYRRKHHACNLFKEEKDDFVMIILYEVQSLKPAAAVFLAQSLEKWLQAHMSENGVTLRGGEQKRARRLLFQTPQQTRAYNAAMVKEKRLDRAYVEHQKAKQRERIKLNPEILIRTRELDCR